MKQCSSNELASKAALMLDFGSALTNIDVKFSSAIESKVAWHDQDEL
jgi:hypothetical protein